MTPLVKALISFLAILIIATFSLAGIGFWKLYLLNQTLFYTTLTIYLLVILVLAILIWRFLFCFKIEVVNLVNKVKEVCDKLVTDLKELVSNPIKLMKEIKKILQLLKK